MNGRKLGSWVLAGIAALVLVTALGASLGPWDATSLERAAPTADRPADRLTAAPPTLVGRADAADGSASDASDPADEVAETNDPVLASGSEEDGAAPADGPDAHLRDGLPLTASHPLVAPVIEIQNRYTRDLLRHPLVVGTATGMNENGEIAIIVLAKAEIHDLPSSIEGVPVRIDVTGEIFASRGKPPGKGGSSETPPVDATARFDRPVPIGVSTGHPAITAGTVGCRVKSGLDLYALSNNHVYADENLAGIADPVIQPGTYDGGASPADEIGNLHAFEPLVFLTVTNGGANVMDAAIASTDAVLLGNATPADGYGTPRPRRTRRRSTSASASTGAPRARRPAGFPAST